MTNYTANIGIEVHVQLKTQSKIFCSCPNQFGSQPNKNICPVCAGYPGVLPVLNKKVVDFAIALGKATNCNITRSCDFARKHYIYPDLPKNFQITQDTKPICADGYIPISLPDNTEKQIKLIRIHMEEDAGKNLHITPTLSFVDLNRAGTPLLEIVSHPDMTNAAEAKAYLTQLHAIIRYLKISDADMEKGSFRADVNISVRKKTDSKLGTKVELKNINSFKFITQAINHEIERQIEALETNKPVLQETRSWDDKQHKTIFMRSKEEAFDYRYFTEPDLPRLEISQAWIDQIEIPELPHQIYRRFQETYGLTSEEASVLTSAQDLSAFFESTVKHCNNAKQASNWILRNLLGYLNEHKLELEHCKITPKALAELISHVEKKTINSSTAQEVFLEMAQTGKTASQIIQEKGLVQISSADELEPIILQIIANNPQQVQEYRNGYERLFTFFVGQTMKATKGKGNPKLIEELLKKHLS